jgi:plasmid stability protein
MGTHIHIRDFDEDLHTILVTRAKAKGLSLSEYLRQELAVMASRPSIDEFMSKLTDIPRPQISRDVLKRAFEEARDERDSRTYNPYGFHESQTPLKK